MNFALRSFASSSSSDEFQIGSNRWPSANNDKVIKQLELSSRAHYLRQGLYGRIGKRLSGLAVPAFPIPI